MTVRKLSQIIAGGSAPALTDQVVGVQGGTTDVLWTASQIAQTILTGGISATVVTPGATLVFVSGVLTAT